MRRSMSLGRNIFYGNTATGYTDYPILPQSQLIQERSNAE